MSVKFSNSSGCVTLEIVWEIWAPANKPSVLTLAKEDDQSLEFISLEALASRTGDSVTVDPAGLGWELGMIKRFLQKPGSSASPYFVFIPPLGGEQGHTLHATGTLKGKPAELAGGYDLAQLSVMVWPNAWRHYDLRSNLNTLMDDGLYFISRLNPLQFWVDEMEKLMTFCDTAADSGEISVSF